MEDLRAGRALRVLRRRRRLRQQDLATATGVAQTTISLIERGHLDTLSLRRVRRVFAGLDAQLRLEVRWRGGALDRLLDGRHAAAVGVLARLLADAGWEPIPEVAFNHYGDRGSVDLLAWHRPSRVLLVAEVKTEVASLEETLRGLDVKARLGPALGLDRCGERPAAVVRLLAVVASTANRDRLARAGAVLDVAFPLRGADSAAGSATLARSAGDWSSSALAMGVVARLGIRTPPRGRRIAPARPERVAGCLGASSGRRPNGAAAWVLARTRLRRRSTPAAASDGADPGADAWVP